MSSAGLTLGSQCAHPRARWGQRGVSGLHPSCPLPQVPARAKPVTAALPDAGLDLLGGADREGCGAREGDEAVLHDARHGAQSRRALAGLVPQLSRALPSQHRVARAGAQGGRTPAFPAPEWVRVYAGE